MIAPRGNHLRVSAPLRVVRAGFTLIELMAVIVIIGILSVFLVPEVISAFDAGEVQACRANMQEMYKQMINYKGKYKKAPTGNGVRFFGELYSKGCFEQTEASARRLTCPAVDVGFLEPEALGIPRVDWFKDLGEVNGGYSAYAGRDTANFPMRKFPPPGAEPLVADDNDPEMNHRTTTNVLLGDGTVATYELFELREQGVLTPEEEVLIVGPESPVEELRKLSLD